MRVLADQFVTPVSNDVSSSVASEWTQSSSTHDLTKPELTITTTSSWSCYFSLIGVAGRGWSVTRTLPSCTSSLELQHWKSLSWFQTRAKYFQVWTRASLKLFVCHFLAFTSFTACGFSW